MTTIVYNRSSSSLSSQTFNKVDDHTLKLYRYVCGLFDVNNVNNKLSDIQLRVGVRTFYCHKFVLAMNSDYFANYLSIPATENLIGINPDYFYDVLQFMYTGELLVNTNNLESLLCAADQLHMYDLMRSCFAFVDSRLNVDNALWFWSLAKKYGQAELAGKCQTEYMNNFNMSKSHVSNISAEMMKVILGDDDLEVKNEVEVCELLMNWLEVQVETGRTVHPDQLLPLIRWSGVGVDYVTSKLLQNTILLSDPASSKFLSKVKTFLLSGAQFKGLQTFHRRSTGLVNSALIIGLTDENNNNNYKSNEIYCINLKHPDRLELLSSAGQPVVTNPGSVACLLNGSVYLTGIIIDGAFFREMWTLHPESGCSRYADLITGRTHHCTAVVDSRLYVFGGLVDSEYTTITSVECYNTETNEWSPAGHLSYAVRNAASVTYKNYIYVFGGSDKNNHTLAHTQVYNPVRKSCTVMDKPMPRACSALRPVLWEQSVILLDCYTCLIYNFETKAWLEREQFKTGTEYFASALDNSTVYIAGGGSCTRRDNTEIWTYSDEVKSVSVFDILEDKPAAWKYHAKLSKPGLINSYVHIPLALRL